MLGIVYLDQLTGSHHTHTYFITIPDWGSNPGPFDLEPTALTVIPPCFGLVMVYDSTK